jgi:histidyl-tRNA synthetase
MEQQGSSFGKRPQTAVYVAARNEAARGAARALTHRLRTEGIAAEQDAGDSVRGGRDFKAQMKAADGMGVPWVCIVGEGDAVTLKNMESGEQADVAPDEAVKRLGVVN